MTTALTSKTFPIRRCTAICHNATKPACFCICNGKNHGSRARLALKTSKYYNIVFSKQPQTPESNPEKNRSSYYAQQAFIFNYGHAASLKPTQTPAR